MCLGLVRIMHTNKQLFYSLPTRFLSIYRKLSLRLIDLVGIINSFLPLLLSFSLAGNLNGNGPCRFIYLNAQSPVGRAIWERLGVVDLLEEVCPPGDRL